MDYVWLPCIHDAYMYYVIDERKKRMTLMLCYECKSRGPHACICHVHRDTFSLCYVSTNAYLRYLCLSWHHVRISFSVASGDLLHIVPNQSKPRGFVYKLVWSVHVHMCGEVLHTRPCPKLESVEGYITILKDRSQPCYVCDCITNPNNRVTYWIFLKILKSRATIIFFR